MASQTAPKIPANDFSVLWEQIREDALRAVDRVGKSGHLILGKEVARFEESLGKYCALHVVGCANGLDAIEIGLRCAGLTPGSKVLTTPLSAFATSLAIVRAGGRPVFVDTDAGGQLDLDEAEAVLKADPSIRFLLPVHLYGHALPLAKLEALRDRFGVTVLEDCAQAIGASSGGRGVGSVGQVAATSFYPTKNLGALGDGGAVLTRSAEIANQARVLRDYGQRQKYEHVALGLNSRLDELHAAILNDALLPRLGEFTKRRCEIAGRYLAGLINPGLKPLGQPKDSKSVWHLFPVLVCGERDLFLQHLSAHGIAGGIHYPKLICDQAALAPGTFDTLGNLPRARAIAGSVASLPIHPALRDEQVARVIEVCNSWPSRS